MCKACEELWGLCNEPGEPIAADLLHVPGDWRGDSVPHTGHWEGAGGAGDQQCAWGDCTHDDLLHVLLLLCGVHERSWQAQARDDLKGAEGVPV